MNKKYPPTAHIRLTVVLLNYLDEKCREMNRREESEVGRNWDRSKYIRQLIKNDMQSTHKAHTPEPRSTRKHYSVPEPKESISSVSEESNLATCSNEEFYDSLLQIK